MVDRGYIDQSLPWTGERYLPNVHGVIELEHLHRYLLAKGLAKGKRVLDIASGEGYGSALLSQTAELVIGVDISAAAVAHAKEKYKSNKNLEYRIGSCSAIPLEPNSIDVVVSFETIEHHDEHESMMLEIKRVLRPGGLLLMSSPDKLEFSDKTGCTNPYHIKELYRNEFVSLVGTYFKNKAISGQRVVYGSAIFSEDTPSVLKSYRVTDDSKQSICGVSDALYLIALASDEELPIVESGLLEQPVGDFENMLSSIASRDAQIEDYRSQADQFDKLLRSSEGKISEQSRIIGERDESIENLNQVILKHEAQIDCYNSQAGEFDRLLRAADNKVLAQSQIIDERDKCIENLNQVILKHEAQIDCYNSQAGEFDQLLRAADNKLLAQSQIIDERDKCIENLNQIILKHEAQIDYYNSRVCEYDQLLRAADNQALAQSQIVAERDKSVACLNQVLFERNEHIGSLDRRLIERDVLIEELRFEAQQLGSRLLSSGNEVACLHQELGAQKEQIDNFHLAVLEFQKKIEKLESILAVQALEIELNQTENSKLIEVICQSIAANNSFP